MTFAPEPAPPRERNLITVHVPEAADPEVRADAVAAVVAMAEPPDDEVSAGFINKMSRFPGRP
ncbi:hypothetical protein [Streptomyces sp. gCLA4]|uniref:hypothetical protein n=1 Tax=Streptomyces sp. gCLA4 TaxID=1873416 RepID=UPI001604194E|nr:hypothetical protein [Streptomyces sp. gCLA4]